MAPPPPRPPSYRNTQDPKVQAILARTDTVRAIDPCSLIDLNAAARLGTISYVGTDTDPAECNVKFSVPQIPDPKPVFEGDTIDQPGVANYIEVGTRAIDFTPGDQLDRPQSSGGCTSFVDTGDVHADRMSELLMYSLAISGGLGTHQRSGCEDLHQVVEGSRRLIKNPGARSSSRRLAQSKLMTLDPCVSLDIFGVGQDVELLSPTRPFQCDYRVRGDKNDDTRREISFWFSDMDSVRNALKWLKEPVKIRGVQSEIETSIPYVGAISCRITAYVGLDAPSAGIDSLSVRPQWASLITVSGRDNTEKCGAILEIASEAIREYQDAK